MGDVTVFGGDPLVVATRLEIERVQANLAMARQLLLEQLEATDFLNQPLKRVGLALEAGPILERISQLQLACELSAQEYFEGEVQSAGRFEAVNQSLAPIVAGLFAAVGGQWGPYRNSEITVSPVSRIDHLSSVNTLTGLLTRLERTAATAPGLVRIEQYPGLTSKDASRFIVYIPGTQAWGPMAGKNPLDLSSNLQAMAGPGLASSEAAVQKAIVAAGVKSQDQVLLVGHSQGGMVAANIASQKQNFAVAGLVTFGSPISQLNQTLRVPAVSIQHTNDLVPKLDLKQNALAKNWVTVERELPVKPSGPGPTVLQAHELSGYRGTALLADQSQEPGLARVRGLITEFSSGQGKATIYEVSR